MKISKQLVLFIAIIGFAIISNAQIPNYVPSNGLVGWWPFNGNANDESGNGNNGTVNGATLISDRFGNVNKAYSFDGSTSSIDCGPLSGIPNSIQDITQNAWVLAPLDQTSFCKLPIMSKRQIINQGWPSIGAGANGTNKAYYFVNSQNYTAGVTNTMFSNPLTNDGNWHMISGTKSGDLYKLYFDGVLQSTQSDSYLLTSNSNLIIGYEAMWGFDCERWYSGRIDDIGIWNRALTECEIQNLYLSQLGAQSTLTQTALDSYTLNGQTYTQSGTYTQVIPAANGCDSTITLNLTLNFTGIHELVNSTKILVKITDINGKIIQRRKNTVMLFIYEDGTVERVVEME
jgi:hypothetical protein